MALNFNFFENDFNLYDSIQDEVCESYGIEVYYLPRKLKKHDLVFGEDPLSFFDQYWKMIMYLNSYNSFSGQGDLFAKFGVNVTDQISLIMNQKRFANTTGNYKPCAEDLIFVPLNKWIFEVFHIEDEDPFYLLGKQSMFRFEARLFEYSNEKMETNLTDVDIINDLDSTDEVSEADELEDEINTILDKSEKDPFGNL